MSVLNWSGVLSPSAAWHVPEEPAENLVLDVRDLRMRYGRTDVLSGVSFGARRGEVLALLGPNGAGKTTTIEILEGFRMRSSGQVSVLGTDPARGGEAWRARIGVVLQSWRDHGKWRVRELLAHLGSYYAPYSGSGGHGGVVPPGAGRAVGQQRGDVVPPAGVGGAAVHEHDAPAIRVSPGPVGDRCPVDGGRPFLDGGVQRGGEPGRW